MKLPAPLLRLWFAAPCLLILPTTAQGQESTSLAPGADPKAPGPGVEPPSPDPEAAPSPNPLSPEPAVKASVTAAAPSVSRNNEAAPSTATEDSIAVMAKLDADLASSDLSNTESQPSLNLYGFADVGFYKYFLHTGSLLNTRLYPNSAFAVGNLNLYLATELGGNWRSLAEVRFTYLPNGNRVVNAASVQRTDTVVTDYTNLGRPRQTGSIMIERAWIEYQADKALTVRVGQWLTPYGVWNIDHGSPTIIPVTRPYVIGLELLPERQTGVMVFGTMYPSDSVSLGYAVGLSNGRGPIQDYADLDEHKALTVRAHGTYRGVGVLDVGVSAYVGRYTNLNYELVTADGSVGTREDVLEQYDEISWGLNARYVQGGLHLQAEFITNDRAYTTAGRPLRMGADFQPDNRRYGAYGVVGYRFDWMGLMPFATAEYFSIVNEYELNRAATQDTITVFGAGLNSRPTANVTLKLEGNIGIFYVDEPKGSAFEFPVAGIQAQIAWAF